MNFLYFAYADDFGDALAKDKNLETVLRAAPVSLRWKAQHYPQETHTSLPPLGQINELRGLYLR